MAATGLGFMAMCKAAREPGECLAPAVVGFFFFHIRKAKTDFHLSVLLRAVCPGHLCLQGRLSPNVWLFQALRLGTGVANKEGLLLPGTTDCFLGLSPIHLLFASHHYARPSPLSPGLLHSAISIHFPHSRLRDFLNIAPLRKPIGRLPRFPGESPSASLPVPPLLPRFCLPLLLHSPHPSHFLSQPV